MVALPITSALVVLYELRCDEVSFLVSLNEAGQPNARQLIVLETPEDEAWGVCAALGGGCVCVLVLGVVPILLSGREIYSI